MSRTDLDLSHVWSVWRQRYSWWATGARRLKAFDGPREAIAFAREQSLAEPKAHFLIHVDHRLPPGWQEWGGPLPAGWKQWEKK